MKEEMVISSKNRSLKYWLQRLANMITKGVRVELNDYKTAYTDGYITYIGVDGEAVQSEKTEKGKYFLTVGLLLHELGHVLFTPFAGKSRVNYGDVTKSLLANGTFPESSSPKSYDKEFFSKHKNSLGSLYSTFSNQVEDGYIEQRLLQKFPSWRKETMYMRNKWFKDAQSYADLKAEGAKDNVILGVLVLNYALNHDAKIYGEKDELVDKFNELKPFLDEALHEQTNHLRVKAVNEAFAKMITVMSWEKPKEEQQNEGSENSETSEGSESNNSDSNDSSNSSNSSDSKNNSSDNSDNGDSTGSTDSANESTDASDNSDSSTDSSNGSNESSDSKDSQSGENTDENGNDANNSSDDGSSDDSSDNGSNDSSGNNPYDTDGSEDSDSADNSPKGSKGSDSTDSQNGNTDNTDSTDGTADNSQTNGNNTQQSSEDSSANNSSSGQGSSSTVPMTDEEIEELLSDLNERTFDEDDASNVNNECNLISSGDKNEPESDASDISSDEMFNQIQNKDTSFSELNRGSIEHNLIEETTSIANKLTHSLKKKIREEKETYQKGLYVGKRLDVKRLYRPDKRIMERKKYPDRPSMVVIELMDISGSIGHNTGKGTRLTEERRIVCTVMKTCKALGIEWQGHAFNGSICPILNENDILSVEPSGGTNDDMAFEYAYNVIHRRDEDRKVIIVTTDGNDGSNSAKIMEILKKCKKENIKVIVCGIGSDRKEIESSWKKGNEDYGADVLNCESDNLCTELSKCIMKVFKRK